MYFIKKLFDYFCNKVNSITIVVVNTVTVRYNCNRNTGNLKLYRYEEESIFPSAN